jgi:hypothetical protein
MNEDADLDEIRMSIYDWQHQLTNMANAIEECAAKNQFSALYDVLGLVSDACSRMDEVLP